MSVQQQSGPGRVVFAGIDWAEKSHVVCLIDADGEVVERVTAGHDKTGIAWLGVVLSRHEVAAVGIERSDGPLVTALLAAGLTVFVIAPSRVKSYRSRYGSAGNKDDRFDAFVLADVVRTDRRRLTPLVTDRPDTQTLRTLVRARKDLIGHRLAIANQLRAHLLTVLPGLVGLFAELDAPTSRAFIADFGTQDAVNALTACTLQPWLRQRHYHVKPATTLLQHLHDAAPGITGPAGQALAAVTHAYLQALNTVIAQSDALEQQITAALAAHPDAPIFTSLPAPGPSARPGCSPRSATAAAGSPPPPHSADWPESPRRPANPATPASSRSAGPSTNNSATPSATSPPTAAEPTPGRRTSTNRPATAGRNTTTPSESSPAPGSPSSGNAGPPAPPTNPPSTAPCKPCSNPPVDTGHSRRGRAHSAWPLARPERLSAPFILRKWSPS